MLSQLLCAIFGHDAEGPSTSTSYQNDRGGYSPYYHCRRCKHSLRWNEQRGGWLAD